jgi:hypothetical protein
MELVGLLSHLGPVLDIDVATLNRAISTRTEIQPPTATGWDRSGGHPRFQGALLFGETLVLLPRSPRSARTDPGVPLSRPGLQPSASASRRGATCCLRPRQQPRPLQDHLFRGSMSHWRADLEIGVRHGPIGSAAFAWHPAVQVVRRRFGCRAPFCLRICSAT